jgi:translation elongation factor EF-G
LSTIEEPIREYVETDPALYFEVNPETGEMLLSGAGELHIEISVEKLTRVGVGIILGKPMIVLKEQMSKDGVSKEYSDLEGSSFTLKAVLSEQYSERGENVLDSLPSVECYLIDNTGKISAQSDEFEWIQEGFKQVMRFGPVAGERVRGVTLIIEKAVFKSSEPETSWRDITQPFIQAARETILSGNPGLYEPWLRLELSTPEEYVGILTSILSRRKGQILEIDSEGHLYKLNAELPVKQSFGLANEIRKETSGWATWGAKPGTYREINM